MEEEDVEGLCSAGLPISFRNEELEAGEAAGDGDGDATFGGRARGDGAAGLKAGAKADEAGKADSVVGFVEGVKAD